MPPLYLHCWTRSIDVTISFGQSEIDVRGEYRIGVFIFVELQKATPTIMSLFGFTLDLNPTYGAYLIGTFISNILLGVTCVQTYIYFREYQDALFVKASVIALLVLELIHGALSMHVVYFYLINNFLNPLGLIKAVWSINVLFGITGSIVLVVHLSYATRIYYVSGRKLPIPIFMVFISLGNFALGWALMALLFRNPLVTTLAGTPDNMAKAILISGAAIDFLIAGTLSYYLNNARTGIAQTDKLIDQLMMYSINNGIITSLFDIVAVVLVFTRPNDLYSLAVSQVIGKLYSNSWMATLNARVRRSQADHSSNEVTSRGLSTFGAASNHIAMPHTTSMLVPSRGNKEGRDIDVASLGSDRGDMQ